jgi:hemin uptake protein HemP
MSPTLPKTRPNVRRTVCVRDLLDGATTLELRLGDQVYVLRLTRSGKLILTK